MSKDSANDLRDLIWVAKGVRPADLVLKRANVVNVFSGEVYEADVALSRDKIAGLGSYHGISEIDLQGRYLVPGFIDSHVHMESSKLAPWEYAAAVVPRGTTTVVMDPHEIANILGLKGIQFLRSAGADLPLTCYLMLPSCVPATDLETSGSKLTSSDLAPLLEQEDVLGIAEVMNYHGLLAGAEEVLEKVRLGREKMKKVDGHAPGLSGKELCAYIAAGIRSDHECVTKEEAQEKLRLGMHVMIREGSAAKNLADLLPAVRSENVFRFLFATDDRSPQDLMEEGHLDHVIRKAIFSGLDPVDAIRVATISPASYFKLDYVGAIAPGYQADLVILEDLKDIRVRGVFKAGVLVAENGKLHRQPPRPQLSLPPTCMRVDWSGFSSLRLAAEREWIKVIDLIPGQIANKMALEKAKIEKGVAIADVDRDILKLAVIERHRASGNVGVGFVRGIGLKQGALGSSVAHDSHNIMVVGADDEEMLAAAREVARMGGGQVVMKGRKTLAALPLPLAGLMSDRSLQEVVAHMSDLKKAAKALGCCLDDPFMALSFLALPVIPELRLTDRGLVDVKKFTIVSPFGEA